MQKDPHSSRQIAEQVFFSLRMEMKDTKRSRDEEQNEGRRLD